ncbi:lysylphosphatidylglycerol synthase transmembrane domain-containing protein [Hoeflea sp.]|uniref:lysylphosphatidylglycerol synthase transmembrane domain-containing protein n=1 Tax=Hoeflea sp. TaxID=1940281 RepID=UPI003A90402F
MRQLRHNLGTIIGLFISGLALAYIVRQFDVGDITTTLRNVDVLPLVPVPFFILGSFAIRAQRWRLLVKHDPPIRYWPSLSALMIGYLFNNVLPARAGDFGRALELGRTEQMSRTKVFATLITERVLDLLATLGILALVLLSYPALPGWLKTAGVTVAAAVLAVLLVLVLSHTIGRVWMLDILRFFTTYLPVSLRERPLKMANSALDGIEGMFRPLHAASFLVLTVVIWSLEVGIVYLTAASIGLQIPLGNALFVLLFLAIGSMVPASPGFVGTYEYFGVSALALVGITGSPALAFIVLLHLITLVGSTLIGGLFYVLRPKESRNAA